MKGLSDHKLTAPSCLTILAAIFQLITATSWQALSKKRICYPKLTEGGLEGSVGSKMEEK